MRTNINYEDFSNSEIKLKMIELENKYESIKNKIKLEINEMNKLDEEYRLIRNVYNKRTKGINYD